MKVNQLCVVTSGAKHRAGRKGYFQFFGRGPSEGTAVLSAEPYTKGSGKAFTLFAVKDNEIVKADE